jgi:hypothetical protein
MHEENIDISVNCKKKKKKKENKKKCFQFVPK